MVIRLNTKGFTNKQCLLRLPGVRPSNYLTCDQGTAYNLGGGRLVGEKSLILPFPRKYIYTICILRLLHFIRLTLILLVCFAEYRCKSSHGRCRETTEGDGTGLCDNLPKG